MQEDLFREGGPHNIRRTGPDQFSMQVELPVDAVGMVARECTDETCSPGVFKVKGGTGITSGHKEAYCPYCRAAADPEDFATREQLRYAEDVAADEAAAGAERMFADALGLGPNRKLTMDGGLFPIEISMEVSPRPPVRRPWEQQFRRDLTCPHCTVEHAVYGLAVWCPDCGRDIFTTHVETESQVLRAMLNDIERRSAELGPRVAARDIENGLEDVVSTFEVALKAMTRRRLLADGNSVQEVNDTMKKEIRNRFQGYEGAAKLLNQLFSLDITGALAPEALKRFKRTLEKRHPITHNLGIVDRKYLERVRTSEAEGRDVNVDEQEVLEALDTALILVRYVHGGLFL